MFTINSQPIKDTFLELINEWKAHYAQTLHTDSIGALREMTEFMTDNLSKL
jgi:hypothetical protein